MRDVLTTDRRGENRDTAFKRWWGTDGRLLCGRITGNWTSNPTPTERKLMEFGFIWGWMQRAKRDAKARRKAK